MGRWSTASSQTSALALVRVTPVIFVVLANGLGGKGYFYVSGSVSDVQAAIDAGRADALKRGLLTRSVVVPRLHAQMKAKILGGGER